MNNYRIEAEAVFFVDANSEREAENTVLDLAFVSLGNFIEIDHIGHIYTIEIDHIGHIYNQGSGP